MIPVIMCFLLIQTPANTIIATIIFIIAAITDGIDGYVARKYNKVTILGKFIDPLADKMLVVSALVCLVQLGSVSAVVAVIIIAREFIVTGFRIIAISEGKVIDANLFGKVKTISQIIAIIAVIMSDILFANTGYIPDILLYISTVITILSGAYYIFKNRKSISNY